MTNNLVDRIAAIATEHSSLDDQAWNKCACGHDAYPWATHLAETIVEYIHDHTYNGDDND
jgi:hypothetical protein